MAKKKNSNVPVKKAATRPAAKSTKAKTTKASQSCAASLSLTEVMSSLEKKGSERTCKTWARHGATGPMFGVLFGDLFTLMKRIDVDHQLARELWSTGNVDAKNLALKIADPLAMMPDELDRWAIENPMPMCILYIATLAAEGPHARDKLSEWLNSSHERLRATGWTLLGRLSDLDESFPEKQLLHRVQEIEKTIHSAPNEVKSNMHRALITMGGRSLALRQAVLAAAKRIGPVTLDQGATACQTPDIAGTVEKMWARSEAKFGSPAAHERSLKSMRRRC